MQGAASVNSKRRGSMCSSCSSPKVRWSSESAASAASPWRASVKGATELSLRCTNPRGRIRSADSSTGTSFGAPRIVQLESSSPPSRRFAFVRQVSTEKTGCSSRALSPTTCTTSDSLSTKISSATRRSPAPNVTRIQPSRRHSRCSKASPGSGARSFTLAFPSFRSREASLKLSVRET